MIDINITVTNTVSKTMRARRTLKIGGELNKKYPGGIERQKELLENEGHTIFNRGKKLFVKDFEDKLVKL